MMHATAPTSLSIKIVTTGVLATTAGMLVATALGAHALLWVALLLILTLALCYLYTPTAYELDDDTLIVHFHGVTKRYEQVQSLSRVPKKVGLGLRLFGNGGVFCGTGIFWTGNLGIFRAYVTSARNEDQVLVQTAKHKIVISPENPAELLD